MAVACVGRRRRRPSPARAAAATGRRWRWPLPSTATACSGCPAPLCWPQPAPSSTSGGRPRRRWCRSTSRPASDLPSGGLLPAIAGATGLSHQKPPPSRCRQVLTLLALAFFGAGRRGRLLPLARAASSGTAHLRRLCCGSTLPLIAACADLRVRASLTGPAGAPGHGRPVLPLPAIVAVGYRRRGPRPLALYLFAGAQLHPRSCRIHCWLGVARCFWHSLPPAVACSTR